MARILYWLAGPAGPAGADGAAGATGPAGPVTVGLILPWPTATPPTGYLLCDGTAVNRTTYAALFAVIGTTFGAGDGSTTFNVPNAKGRTIMGGDAAQTEFDTLGETGGAKTHTLTTAQLPAHTHPAPDSGFFTYVPSGPPQNLASGANFGMTTQVATGSTGSGAAHNILQPYIVLNYVIRT